MSRRSPLAPLRALRTDRTVQAVLALVALGLLARLALLGQRVAHQDEARVGYWTVRFLVTGQYEYRPIVHGPFIPVVNRPLFALFGPSDFVSRLPIAVVGALAPAGAILFRTRLRDSEVVALSFLLAFNPLLLYYSRFMRQDVPLATFALLAVGLFVRAMDAEAGARTRRYVYAGGIALGLAFTTKENAILYPVCWAGALVLLFDHRLFRARVRGSSPLAVARAAVPDPPANPTVDLSPVVRGVGLLALLAANPVVLALGAGGDEFVLVSGILVAVGGYAVAVRAPTVWHFVPALAMAWPTVALPAGILTPAEGTFWFALWWILGVLLLFDERVFGYAGAGARPGEAPAEHPGLAPDGGDPDRSADEGSGDPARSTGEESGDAADDGASDGTDPAGPDPAGSAPRNSPGSRGGWTDRVLSVPPLGVAYLLFLLVIVVFYAPRGGGYPAPAGDATVGLWSAVTSLSPAALDAVFWEATFGTWQRFWGTWAAGGHQDHAYLPYLEHFLRTMAWGALVVSIAAGIGFVVDRYGPDGPRDLVAFAGYWGVASVAGYPLVTDIRAAWTSVHAVVPLAIPAAVGIALVFRVGRRALADDRAHDVAVAAVILLLVGVQVGYAAGTQVYLSPQSPDNELVQYAQSSSTDMKPVLRDARAIARENGGVDVLFYGDEFDSPSESAHDLPPAGPGWFARLPIAWYLEGYEYELREDGHNLTVDSTLQEVEVRRSGAPVVVALRETEGRSVPYNGESIEPYIEGYRAFYGHRYLYDTGTPSSIVIYVDTSLLEDPRGSYDRVVGNESVGRIAGVPPSDRPVG